MFNSNCCYQDAEIHWISVMFSVQMLKSLFKEYGQIESIRFRSVVRYFFRGYVAFTFATLQNSVRKGCTLINSEAGLGGYILPLEEALEILPQRHHWCIFPFITLYLSCNSSLYDRSCIFCPRSMPVLLGV